MFDDTPTVVLQQDAAVARLDASPMGLLQFVSVGPLAVRVRHLGHLPGTEGVAGLGGLHHLRRLRRLCQGRWSAGERVLNPGAIDAMRHPAAGAVSTSTMVQPPSLNRHPAQAMPCHR